MATPQAVLCSRRSAAQDDAQPAAGPRRRVGLLQAPAPQQQRRQAAAPADGAVALLVLALRPGAAGGQPGQLLQRHQERSAILAALLCNTGQKS